MQAKEDNKITYKDIEQRIGQINSDSTAEAVNYFNKNIKISKRAPFFHGIVGLTYNLFFKKRAESRYNRFLETFFNAFSDFLTRLKLLKLHNKL
jgi:hypothetical protein